MRILIIEDDLPTSKALEATLKSESFVCDLTNSGEDGLDLAKIYDYDLILLDLMLPDVEGYEVIRRLRTVQVNTPILILSGLTDTDDKVKGLGFGADDYLTKPFDKQELVARVNAIVRRSKGHSNSHIKIGRMTVNLNTKMVDIDNKYLNLTGREYAILELMALRKGATLSKEVFLNHLYGGLEEPEFKIIDVFICKLRKKLSDVLGGESYIKTLWGRGYVLEEPKATPRALNDSNNSDTPSKVSNGTS